MLFTMANVGLPGTGGFVGELLTLVGAFQANTWVAFIATTGVILSAAYALWLYRRVVFGELTKDDVKAMLDMSPREIATFAPLVVKSEEHTSELQSLMRISYAVFCLTKQTNTHNKRRLEREN